MKVKVVQPDGSVSYNCEHAREWLALFNQLAVQRGLVKQCVDVMQGGYHKGVSASGGTHDEGGVADLAQLGTELIHLAREAGAAAWHRVPSQGFDAEHTHLVLIGDPCNGPARYQVGEYLAGKNGLARHRPGPDDAWRPRVQRNHIQGIAWMKEQLNNAGGAAAGTTVKDWFDMASKEDLKNAIREVLWEPVVPPEKGKPKGLINSSWRNNMLSLQTKLDQLLKGHK